MRVIKNYKNLALKGGYMSSQKYEPMLNLSLDLTYEERTQSETLDIGYDLEEDIWTVIIRYSGSIEFLRDYNIKIEYLEGNYAILLVPDVMVRRLCEFKEIIYVELPKKMFMMIEEGLSASCISPLISNEFRGGALTGEGILCGIVDSGIDIFHEVFRNNDGSTRILELWDQSIDGNPPPGYFSGSIFYENDINFLIENRDNNENSNGNLVDNNMNVSTNISNNIIPGRDISGHGTHVAGIMAGNFAMDKENNLGIATKSRLVIVKLKTNEKNGFPSTVQLMEAINYLYQTALKYKQPISINISFGNSYGSHDGTSLIETYIDNISKLWKMTISIGAGNEGASAGHAKEEFVSGETKRISFSVGNYERTINIQIWKSYEDEFEFTIYAPGGTNNYKLSNSPGTTNIRLGNNRLLIYYGEPSPYSRFQEVYIQIIPYYDEDLFITSGVWSIVVSAVAVANGRVDMWLPDSAILGENTGFNNPSPKTTLTIPSTSVSAISVGGYNSRINAYADFSGRGYTRVTNQIKPDIVAPAVDIISASAGGGLTSKSGTSMACPFVSGSAALLMEWGLVRGNDPYLYGEKVKAYLISGARIIAGESVPSERIGWGALCTADSLP